MRILTVATSLILAALISVWGLHFFMEEDLEAFVPPLVVEGVRRQLPPAPFTLSSEAYGRIGMGPLALRAEPLRRQLPDLRGELLFLGRNERPDLKAPHFRLALAKEEGFHSFEAGKKIYLKYLKGAVRSPVEERRFRDGALFEEEPTPLFTKGSYTFSPQNIPTSLWIELRFFEEAESVEVTLGMLDETRMPLSEPEERRRFLLPLGTTSGRLATGGWELGSNRVDTTLFARQKARWRGRDCFLAMHGGEEFAFALGRERIDFFDGMTPYTVFVKEGEFLVWRENRWAPVGSSESFGHPLLVCKKLDDRILTFDLWDGQGAQKLQLSLIRSQEMREMVNVHEQLSFVGAKTRAQFIISSNQKRLLLRPNDWLLCHEGEWKKIGSAQEVDDYVSARLQGPLFVLDTVTKKNGRQVLLGHLFNTARTEVKEIELSAHQPTLAAASARSPFGDEEDEEP